MLIFSVEPNVEAIDRKAGDAIKAFKDLVFPDDYNPAGKPAPKRKVDTVWFLFCMQCLVKNAMLIERKTATFDYCQGWWMVNVRPCEKARLAFLFGSVRHFDFFNCKTDMSKCVNVSLRCSGSKTFRHHL